MQGKPINFDSLKEAGQKVNSFYNENKSEIAKTGASIWKVARIDLGGIAALITINILASLVSFIIIF